MADYFVASGGSNTAPYDTWAKAATSLQTALTAATGAGDRVVIQYNGVPAGDAELGSDTTYTFGGDIALISSTNSGTATITPTVMGTANWIGNSTTNRGISFAGANFKVCIWGVTLRTAGSTGDNISLAAGQGTHMMWDSCYIWHGNTGGSVIRVGIGSEGYTDLVNCTLRFGATSQYIDVAGPASITGGSVSSAGSVPADFIKALNASSCSVYFDGVDLSHCTGNILGANAVLCLDVVLTNCKLGSGVVLFEAATVPTRGAGSVTVFNCSTTDQHYHLGYYNALGEVTVSTSVYATDAAASNKYDGTNRCSWKVVTTANCSFYSPFITPWFEMYHDGTAAITPSIEVLADRTGSPLKDDEIWGEWSYQGTSGSTQASFVNDRRALVATAANQADSSLTASDWTGETAGSPTPWFGKLAPASAITPAEIGMLRARVCVGKPSTTVYVDPTPRYS